MDSHNLLSKLSYAEAAARKPEIDTEQQAQQSEQQSQPRQSFDSEEEVKWLQREMKGSFQTEKKKSGMGNVFDKAKNKILPSSSKHTLPGSEEEAEKKREKEAEKQKRKKEYEGMKDKLVFGQGGMNING